MRKNIILSVVVAAVMFAGCSKGEDSVSPKKTIGVKASVETGATRAGYEGTSVLPEQFVMDIVQGDASYNYSKVLMTKDPASNAYYAPSDLVMKWKSGDYEGVTVKAMTYPYGLSSISNSYMDVSVAEDQSTSDEVKASDLLVADSTNEGDVEIVDGDISIEFKHLFTKLYITYGLSAELQSSDFEINSVKLKNICVSARYSYYYMEFNASANYNTFGHIEMHHNPEGKAIEAIFLPYVPTENPVLCIDATIDGVRRLFNCSVVPKSEEGFVSGMRYTMHLTLSGSAIKSTTVEIKDGWDENTEDTYFETL